jgi:hypothetical protein
VPPALESNGLIRTSRCTPLSQESLPNANGPLTRSVIERMPASSPGVMSSSSYLNLFSSK